MSQSPKAKELLQTTRNRSGGIYGSIDQPGLMHLGYPDHGHLSTYYPDSPNITQEEIALIGEFLATRKLLPENTRLRKLQNGDFEVLVASAVQRPPPDTIDVGSSTSFDLEGKLKGRKLDIVFGDHQEEMAKISLHMKKAGLNGADDTQRKMMEEYAKSFGTGSLNAFKESQKYWVKNLAPTVESNIGFIESYRDPSGVRSEWEGFGELCAALHIIIDLLIYLVATVNKERTEAFSKLVAGAPSMIPKLPWGKDFEKDSFVAPDFTSLEVLSFAGSG